MTLTVVPGGLLWLYPGNLAGGAYGALTTNATLAATADKLALIGYCYIDGRPASKTMGGGSSLISFRTGTCTFANGATTLDIGIQDVTTGSGPPGQPDGTFDCKTTLTAPTGITTAAWNDVAIGSGAGTKTISHGQLIAVVFDMTNRAGADSVIIQRPTGTTGGMPTTNTFTAAAWGSGTEGCPNVLLTFSDGTIGHLEGGGFFTTFANETWSDSTNPDERGNIFRVPWDCKVDALWANVSVGGNTADFTITLYSDPAGTPTSAASVTVDAETYGITSGIGPTVFPLSSEVTLTRNTDYVVAVKGTGAGSVSLLAATVNSSAYLALWPGTTDANKATRDGLSGAFTEAGTIRYLCGVRISSLQDTSGAGSGPKTTSMMGGFNG